MRKIAYDLSNVDYLEILKSFAAKEGIELVEYSDITSEVSIIFVITDKEEVIGDINKSYKVCLVGGKRDSKFAISKGFNETTLRVLLDTIYHGGALWNITTGAGCTNFVQEYRIDNDIVNLESIVNSSTARLLHRLTFMELEKMRVGISEMLINAIEHGNLNITGEEKFEATESGALSALTQERLDDVRYKDRTVYYLIELNKDFLQITIEDEGDGFDINSLPDPNDPEQLFKLHGRGILIAKAYYTSITYNEKGNKIVMRKNLN